MERTVLKYAPSYWDTSYEVNTQIQENKFSTQYTKIENEIKEATGNSKISINSIKRNQNIHDYGQLLVREQLLTVAEPYKNFYRVRRYITIQRPYLTTALEYNLDHRRCGKRNLLFQKHITVNYNDVILVVQVITSTPNAEGISPTNSSDYFIDYIVDVDC